MSQDKTPQKDEIWTTEDGTKIPVGQLSEDHAKNILRMILKNSREREEFHKRVMKDLLPAIIERIKEEHPGAEIAGLNVDGEDVPLDNASGAEEVDQAFQKAGAAGKNLH